MIKKVLVILFLLSATIYPLIYIHNVDRTPLNWDEVDYVSATKQGLLSNYSERNSLGILQFYKLGTLKRNGDSVGLARFVKDLPEERKDPFILRHFHPPLPNYYWSLCAPFIHSDVDWKRTLIPWTWISVVIVLLSFLLAGNKKEDLLFIAGAVAVLLTSAVSVFSFTGLNYHIFHLPAVILFTAVLQRHLQDPTKRNDVLLGITITFLLLTLEMGVIVLIGAFVSLVIIRRWRALLQMKRIFRILMVFVVSMFELWPGFFFSGGTLKSVMMYVYRIFSNGNEEYGNVNGFALWKIIFVQNIPLIVFVLSGIVGTVVLAIRKKLPSQLKVSFLIGMFYTVVMTKFMISETYVLPALGILCFHSALIFRELCQEQRAVIYYTGIVFILITASIGVTDLGGMNKASLVKEQEFNVTMERIRSLASRNEPILATGIHIIHNQQPDMNLVPLLRKTMNDTCLYTREHYQLRDLNNEIANRKFGAIIIFKEFVYSEKMYRKLRDAGYEMELLYDTRIFTPIR